MAQESFGHTVGQADYHTGSIKGWQPLMLHR